MSSVINFSEQKSIFVSFEDQILNSYNFIKTSAKYHVCNHCVIGEKTFQNILIGPGKLPGLSRNGSPVTNGTFCWGPCLGQEGREGGRMVAAMKQRLIVPAEVICHGFQRIETSRISLLDALDLRSFL